jgi:AbrB family transcriptional regulator (stage V sporulation protein T)
VDEQDSNLYSQVFQPIICAGDAIGSVVLMGKTEKDVMGDAEKMLVQTAAGFLGRQMEQ